MELRKPRPPILRLAAWGARMLSILTRFNGLVHSRLPTWVPRQHKNEPTDLCGAILLVTISEIAQAIQIVGEQLSIARQNVSTTESALERPNYVVSLTRFVDVFVPLPLKLT